jgi:hypothetical protein
VITSKRTITGDKIKSEPITKGIRMAFFVLAYLGRKKNHANQLMAKAKRGNPSRGLKACPDHKYRKLQIIIAAAWARQPTTTVGY